MTLEPVKKRIAALLKMTASAGCSEAEALAAASKAAELMQEHGLSETDIVFGQASARNRSRGTSVRDTLWSTVAHCTNTGCIITFSVGERGADIVFVGREPGPEIAAYLAAVLNRAIDSAVALFRREAFYRRRKTAKTRKLAVQDFTQGLVLRLERRLRELFSSVMNTEAVAQALAMRDERFPDSTKCKPPQINTRFDEAVNSGWRAGGKVNLAHGVGGGRPAPQIGRA